MPDYSSTDSPKGQLLEFSQTEFTEQNDPSSIGLNDRGYVFVPDSCATKTTGKFLGNTIVKRRHLFLLSFFSGVTACRVHIAFHGCKHGDDSVAEAFANDAGYNDVAALNNIVVLYPQSTAMPIQNPQDCWDW